MECFLGFLFQNSNHFFRSCLSGNIYCRFPLICSTSFAKFCLVIRLVLLQIPFPFTYPFDILNFGSLLQFVPPVLYLVLLHRFHFLYIPVIFNSSFLASYIFFLWKLLLFKYLTCIFFGYIFIFQLLFHSITVKNLFSSCCSFYN